MLNIRHGSYSGEHFARKLLLRQMACSGCPVAPGIRLHAQRDLRRQQEEKRENLNLSRTGLEAYAGISRRILLPQATQDEKQKNSTVRGLK